MNNQRGDVTKEPTRAERIALALIDALEKFLDKYPFIEEWFVRVVFFVFKMLLNIIRVFAHAKRRWAQENMFLEKIGLVFIKRWFRAFWRFGRWIFK